MGILSGDFEWGLGALCFLRPHALASCSMEGLGSEMYDFFENGSLWKSNLGRSVRVRVRVRVRVG